MDRSQVNPKRELFRKLLRNIPSETVIRAMEQVPRELFVPQDSRHMAYLDLPLSIGEGQTISQPYIVAMMTEAMERITVSDGILRSNLRKSSRFGLTWLLCMRKNLTIYPL